MPENQTPGQAAYEEWVRLNAATPSLGWDGLLADVQEAWESIADAAVRASWKV